jgi:hypothetical protein
MAYGENITADPNDANAWIVHVHVGESIVQPPTADFAAEITWDGTHQYVSITNLSPSGYTYTFHGWSAEWGSITVDHGSWAAVGLVTHNGIARSGKFSIEVTASQAGMLSKSQVFIMEIRNNQPYVSPD